MMEKFTAQICACEDKACADRVQEDMMKWGTEMAKNAPRDDKPDAALVKRMTTIMERYTECATRLFGGPITPTAPAAPQGAHTLEALLRLARDQAARTKKPLVLSKLVASYLHANGTVDAKYGSLTVEFRRPRVDDQRPIGAPVTPETADVACPMYTFDAQGWRAELTDCTPQQELAPPRCTAQQIWSRAIADHVPAQALATLALVPPGGDVRQQSWMFSIVDDPRGIDIRKTYPDDCQPVVEHP